MHLLMVFVCLAAYTTASGSPAALNSVSTNTSFFSMPVQFSMAAPLPDSLKSSDWSPSISSRRGYLGPPAPKLRWRKHRPSPPYALRRHPLQRIYPKYPPSLEPYSHNYKQNNLHHPPPSNNYFTPAAHRFPLEHRPQHNSYVEYPPYASRYHPTGNDHLESTRHQPPHEYQGEVQQHHPAPTGEYSQYPPHLHLPQLQPNDQNLHLNNHQSPDTMDYHQDPSQFLSHEQSYPPKHQAHNFEYPQLPPDYEAGETFSQNPNPNHQHYQGIPEPHIPHYPSSEYNMGSSMSQHPSQMQPHPNCQPHSPASPPPPEYNPEMAKELLELNKEMSLMQQEGNSNKSILHLLVPLLMLGISIPALGYMYSHMIRRRSFQDLSSLDSIQEYMELLQRGIECYQHKEQCSVS